MNIGTIEPIIAKEIEPKGRLRFPLGAPPPGNGGGGGDGGGDDDFQRPEVENTPSETTDKSKIITAVLLLVVLMTFGGLIGAYVVISTNGAAEWRPFNLPVQVWISTALIILSSITYHFAKMAIDGEDRFDVSRRWLIATAVLGAAFISSQLLVWLALVRDGVYMSGNPYAGFFYIMTAVHAAHVLGGIAALGAILLRSWNETQYGPELKYRRNLARSVGWYWHFMGFLWLVLFVLLGFWK